MTRIDPVTYNGVEIIPLQFLKAVLPDPGDLGKTTKGKTCIGNVITGVKDGKFKAVYIYNICDHEKCFEEVGSQAISYTTGVPAMIGAGNDPHRQMVRCRSLQHGAERSGSVHGGAQQARPALALHRTHGRTGEKPASPVTPSVSRFLPLFRTVPPHGRDGPFYSLFHDVLFS